MYESCHLVWPARLLISTSLTSFDEISFKNSVDGDIEDSARYNIIGEGELRGLARQTTYFPLENYSTVYV